VRPVYLASELTSGAQVACQANRRAGRWDLARLTRLCIIGAQRCLEVGQAPSGPGPVAGRQAAPQCQYGRWSVRLVRPAWRIGGENGEIARSGSLLFALDERETLLAGAWWSTGGDSTRSPDGGRSLQVWLRVAGPDTSVSAIGHDGWSAPGSDGGRRGGGTVADAGGLEGGVIVPERDEDPGEAPRQGAARAPCAAPGCEMIEKALRRCARGRRTPRRD